MPCQSHAASLAPTGTPRATNKPNRQDLSVPSGTISSTDYYSFAVVALPALWVAAGLQRALEDATRRRALARSVLRAVLALAEVSSVTVLAVGHDGYAGAALTTLGLIAGTTTVIAGSAQRDLSRLGLSHGWVWAAISSLLLTAIAYATAR